MDGVLLGKEDAHQKEETKKRVSGLVTNTIFYRSAMAQRI
jgi:hypothetical protein